MKSPYEDIPPPDEEHINDLKNIASHDNAYKASRVTWITIIAVIAAASVIYRLLVLTHVEQTALMFIGLPTFLAICLTTTDPAKSVSGHIAKGITMFLLLLAILAIEGAICILIAAPLFYLVGGIIGAICDYFNTKDANKRGPYGIAAGLLLVLSVEGVNENLSFGREEHVTVSEHVNFNLTETKNQIALGPKFKLQELPMFLKLGFPTPQSIQGSGIAVGDEWNIHFAGGEGSPGDLIVKVTESTSNKITFTNISDTSHIAHWLHWKSITWELTETTDGTKIDLHLKYRRDLDPAWYFKPIERYGVKKAGEYFINQTFAQ